MQMNLIPRVKQCILVCFYFPSANDNILQFAFYGLSFHFHCQARASSTSSRILIRREFVKFLKIGL